MVSKAMLRLIIKHVTSLLSIASRMLDFTFSNAVSVEWLSLYAD